MKFPRLNNNWNKVNTKEELIELLNGYRGILTTDMVEYLDSLIELEFSVVRDYIGESDRKALSELDIYKKVAIYNIYNKALNLFQQKEEKYEVSVDNDGEELTVSSKYKNIKLFEFDYAGEKFSTIPEGYKTMKIGTILIYQILDGKEFREVEIEEVRKKLERLHDKTNPYDFKANRFGGPNSLWRFEHEQEIRNCKEQLKKLDSKKELTSEDKEQIEITNQTRSLLLEDYGLTDDSFIQKTRGDSNLQKTLVKQQPNLTILNQIKYI